MSPSSCTRTTRCRTRVPATSPSTSSSDRIELSPDEDGWVPQHHHRLREPYERVHAQMVNHADQRKVRHDQRAHELPLAAGERVYLHNHGVRRRHNRVIWRYLQLNYRYLKLNYTYLKLNYRYLQIYGFADICNSIADI